MQKDKTQIARLFLFCKQVLTEEPEVNSYIARLPNRIFTLSHSLHTGGWGASRGGISPSGCWSRDCGGARDCLGHWTHLRGLGSLSTDSGLSGRKVQVTATSYCPPWQNPEHGRPGIPATGDLGCVAVMFGRACWKEPPSLTAHRDPELKASPPMCKAFRSKGNCLSPDSNFCQHPMLACPPRPVLPNSSSPPRPAPRRPPLPSLLTPGRVFVSFPPSASPSPPQRAGQTGRGAGRWLRPTLPAFMLPVLQAARSFAL